MHVIAAKAVAFGEALRPDFKVYAKNVVENAKALAETLRASGLDIVSGGTDNHLMLVDLRPKGLTGKVSEKALGPRRASPATRTASPSIPKSRSSPRASVSARRPAPRAASASPSSSRSASMIAEVLDALAQSAGRQGAAGRSRGQGAREGAHRPLPDLSVRVSNGCVRETAAARCAVPSCDSLDTQVKDSASDRGSAVDPAAARLHRLQLPLHHLRARAAARTDRDQAQRPARAVRPRQAGALAADRAAQAAGRAGAGREDGLRHRARAGKRRRERRSRPKRSARS